MPYFIKYFNDCNTFDDLPCILYTKKNKTLRFLPPTSNMSRGDDLRTLCCFKLFKSHIGTRHQFESSGSCYSVLMPNKFIVTLPKICTVTFGCKKNALEDVSAVSLALHAQNFASAREKNVLPKFTNRLSLTRHKICKYKGFF